METKPDDLSANEGNVLESGVKTKPELTEDTSHDKVDVQFVPTPPQTPKDGSRPSSSSRKVKTPSAAAGVAEGENVVEQASENKGDSKTEPAAPSDALLSGNTSTDHGHGRVTDDPAVNYGGECFVITGYIPL